MSRPCVSHREAGLAVLPQLPALIVQAGDIGVVLVSLGEPGGGSGLHDLNLTGRYIVIKCCGRWRGGRSGRTIRKGEGHEESQETAPWSSSWSMTIAYHICFTSWTRSDLLALS